MDGIRHFEKPVRVILANGPRLFREMLERVFKKQLDLQVVAEVGDLSRLPEVITQTRADWVIVSLLTNGKFPHYTELLLRLNPKIGVLAVAMDGSQVKVKSGNKSEDLKGISLDDLLMILHSFSMTRLTNRIIWTDPIFELGDLNGNGSSSKGRLN